MAEGSHKSPLLDERQTTALQAAEEQALPLGGGGNKVAAQQYQWLITQMLKPEKRTASTSMPYRRRCGISRPPAYAPTEPGCPGFLKGFTSWLHADRYFVYHRLSYTTQKISRWTHLRRKPGKAVRDLQKSQQSGYSAQRGLQYLLKLERDLSRVFYHSATN